MSEPVDKGENKDEEDKEISKVPARGALRLGTLYTLTDFLGTLPAPIVSLKDNEFIQIFLLRSSKHWFKH